MDPQTTVINSDSEDGVQEAEISITYFDAINDIIQESKILPENNDPTTEVFFLPTPTGSENPGIIDPNGPKPAIILCNDGQISSTSEDFEQDPPNKNSSNIELEETIKINDAITLNLKIQKQISEKNKDNQDYEPDKQPNAEESEILNFSNTAQSSINSPYQELLHGEIYVEGPEVIIALNSSFKDPNSSSEGYPVLEDSESPIPSEEDTGEKDSDSNIFSKLKFWNKNAQENCTQNEPKMEQYPYKDESYIDPHKQKILKNIFLKKNVSTNNTTNSIKKLKLSRKYDAITGSIIKKKKENTSPNKKSTTSLIIEKINKFAEAIAKAKDIPLIDMEIEEEIFKKREEKEDFETVLQIAQEDLNPAANFSISEKSEVIGDSNLIQEARTYENYRNSTIWFRKNFGINNDTYLDAIGHIIGNQNIKAINTDNKFKIEIVLNNPENAQTIIQKGINVEGTHIKAYLMNEKPLKIMLSNVPIFIPNCKLSDEFQKYGNCSEADVILQTAYTTDPEQKHINTYRRAIWLRTEGGPPQLPDQIVIYFAGKPFTIGVAIANKCYTCGKIGHNKIQCRSSLNPNFIPLGKNLKFIPKTAQIPGASFGNIPPNEHRKEEEQHNTVNNNYYNSSHGQEWKIANKNKENKTRSPYKAHPYPTRTTRTEKEVEKMIPIKSVTKEQEEILPKNIDIIPNATIPESKGKKKNKVPSKKEIYKRQLLIDIYKEAETAKNEKNHYEGFNNKEIHIKEAWDILYNNYEFFDEKKIFVKIHSFLSAQEGEKDPTNKQGTQSQKRPKKEIYQTESEEVITKKIEQEEGNLTTEQGTSESPIKRKIKYNPTTEGKMDYTITQKEKEMIIKNPILCIPKYQIEESIYISSESEDEEKIINKDRKNNNIDTHKTHKELIKVL